MFPFGEFFGKVPKIGITVTAYRNILGFLVFDKRIMMGCSPLLSILCSIEGQDLAPILEKVPDEFYDWVKETHTQLLTKFAEIEAIWKANFRILETRKDTTLYFQTCRYPAVLFKMFDQKPYDEII